MRIWLLVLYILLSSGNRLFPQEFSFRSVSVENGLSNNFIKTIFRDQAGFIWLGTLDGLDRFDGTEIKSYSRKAINSRESVNCLYEDDNGILWIGTENGLFRFDKKHEISGKVKLDSVVVKVYTITSGKDKKLYVGTNNGLFIYDDKNGLKHHILFNSNNNSGTNHVTGIVQGQDQVIWISTLRGLIKFSTANREINSFSPDQISSNDFVGLTGGGSSLCIATKKNGLVLFDTETERFSFYKSVSDNIVLTISGDGGNKIFVGTDGDGLKIIDVKTGRVTSLYHDSNDPSSICSNTVYSFLCDHKDIYWVGTFSAGLSYGQSARIIKSFSPLIKSNFHNKGIRSFYFEQDGDKCIGTRDGFVFYSGKNNSIKLFRTENVPDRKLRSNIILSIYPFQGKTLLGTYGGGISVFDKTTGKFSNFIENEDFLRGCIYGFETDSSGNLWIATLHGVFKFNPATTELKHYATENSGLSSDEVFSIRIDSKERIWLGTMNGFFLFDPKQDSVISLEGKYNQKLSFKTTYICEDSNKDIWFCTEKGGIFVLNGNLSSMENITTAHGLPDNSVCAVLEEEDNKFWISTLKGFGCFNSSKKTFQSYTISDGLPSLVFNPAACYKTDKGELWWGNEKGLVYFHPDSFNNKRTTPEVRFTVFYLSGKEVEVGPGSPLSASIENTQEIILKHQQNSIGFRFVALSYIHPGDNHYLCKLEGHDTEWRILNGVNSIYYDKLPSGNYVFKVKMKGAEDEKAVARIKVYIKPSFFGAYFFIAVVILITITILWIKNRYFKKIPAVPQPGNSQHDKYKTSKIQLETGLVIKEALIQYMEEKKPYLNAELKLADLAEEIKYPAHEISQVLNQYLNQNFADFVNTYRVEEIKKRLSDDNYSKFTLTAIAQQCGFNSKTSFFRVFKKLTGKTPADYFKESKANLQ